MIRLASGCLQMVSISRIPENGTPKQLKAGIDALRRVTLQLCQSANVRTSMRARIDLTWTYPDQAGGLVTQVNLNEDVCLAEGAPHS